MEVSFDVLMLKTMKICIEFFNCYPPLVSKIVIKNCVHFGILYPLAKLINAIMKTISL